MPEDHAQPEPKRHWFDPVCAIVMAVSSLATVWCSYQNSRWSGQAADLEGTAGKRERDAVGLHLEARQFESVHLHLAMEAIDARMSGDGKREAFYVARFPAELKVAWEKWLALKPFEDAAAPPHPFDSRLYTPLFDAEIKRARFESSEAKDAARAANQSAGAYLGDTVLLATVLFFAGTAGKFDQRSVRLASLVFALSLLVFAAGRVVMLPIR